MAASLTKNTAWEGKTGTQVESFIKTSLENKIGVVWEDEKNGLYLCFADATNRDAYIADNTKTYLILGSFKAGAKVGNANIFVSSGDAVIVPVGATGNKIQMYFEIRDTAGNLTNETATVSFTVRDGDNNIYDTVTKTDQQGGSSNPIEFPLDLFLKEGTNSIRIDVRGDATGVYAYKVVTYEVYNGIRIKDVQETMICGNEYQLEYEVAEGIELQSGSAVWAIVKGASGDTISANGLLSTTITENTNRDITVQVSVATTNMTTLSAKKTFQVKRYAVPTGVSINGSSGISADTTYTLELSSSDISIEYETEWNLTGEAVDNKVVQMGNKNANSCEVKVLKNLTDTAYTFTLSATISYSWIGTMYALQAEKVVRVGAQSTSAYQATWIRINQNISDPDAMITLATDLGDNGEQLQSIRSYSHRYLGKYTGEGEMTICQLSDADSNFFAANQGATKATLSGAQGDVFMKLPHFWYCAVKESDNVWRVGFSRNAERPGINWKEWSGNDLIGVYMASIMSEQARSVSGATPKTNYSPSQFDKDISKRGTGYGMLRFIHHSIMAFLFFAYYKNTNSQAKCGAGREQGTSQTGSTDKLGMTDTTPTTVSQTGGSVNFWGLEDWWGRYSECIGYLAVDCYDGYTGWEVIDPDNGDRSYETHQSHDKDFYINKLAIGEYLDAVPGEPSGGTSNTGYCDCFRTNRSFFRGYVVRGGSGSNACNGITYLNTKMTYDTHTDTEVGARLIFSGNIVEEANPTDFMNI